MSADFPVTLGAFDTTFNGSGAGNGDGFVTKLSATGTGPVFTPCAPATPLVSFQCRLNPGLGFVDARAGRRALRGPERSESLELLGEHAFAAQPVHP